MFLKRINRTKRLACCISAIRFLRLAAIRVFLLTVVFTSGPLLRIHAQDSEASSAIQELKRLSLEELMRLEVTSVSKRPEKLIETSSAIQVITHEDIRHSGATSVPEVLRLASNLQVAQVNASQWAISARGFNNVLANKLLILIDGRVVYTPLYAGVFWDVQNLLLEDIDRIEVISGPGGTLWGANAVNGVINIITKNAKDTRGLYAEGAVGTELRSQGSLRYGGSIGDNISYRVYGTAFKRDNSIFRDSVDSKDGWHMAQGGVRLDWDATGEDAVSFQANGYNGRPDPDGGNPVVARGSNVLARWNHSGTPESNFQVQVYFDQTWRDLRNGFAEKLRTYDLEGHHRLQVGSRHGLTYGLGFRLMDHDVQNLELFAFLPARKSLYLYSAFVQDAISLMEEELTLTLGLKVEHNSYTDFQYQPNVRLHWALAPGQAIWSAVSRGVRNPARIDREFFLFIAPGIPFIEGSDFQSEEVLAYELGWRMQHQDNFSLSLAMFYNQYDNIRSAELGPPPFNIPVTFGNGVHGNTYGLELSGTYHLNEWWRLRGGYTLMRKELAVKPNSTDTNQGTAESNDPNYQVMLQSEMEVRRNLEVGAVFRFVDELPKPYVEAYAGLDLRVAWKIHRTFEISVVGQNLLQESHTEFIPESPEPKGIERSVYGKVAIRF
jgi:iron complex outermembrane recepter protein